MIMMMRTMMRNWAGNARIVITLAYETKSLKVAQCVSVPGYLLLPQTVQSYITKDFFKQKKQFMAKVMIFHNAGLVQGYNPTCCLIIETINQLLTLLPLARKHATPDFSFVDSFKSKSIHG